MLLDMATISIKFYFFTFAQLREKPSHFPGV